MSLTGQFTLRVSCSQLILSSLTLPWPLYEGFTAVLEPTPELPGGKRLLVFTECHCHDIYKSFPEELTFERSTLLLTPIFASRRALSALFLFHLSCLPRIFKLLFLQCRPCLWRDTEQKMTLKTPVGKLGRCNTCRGVFNGLTIGRVE